MIVQPASTNPRRPAGRALRIAGVVAPVGLLVAVVAAALAGPQPAPVATPPPAAAASPGPPAAAVEGAPASLPPMPLAFPTVAADLAVLSIPEATARVDTGNDAPFAVAGWLGDVGTYDPCPAAAGDPAGSLGPMCLRHGLLEARSSTATDPARLAVTIGIGTRLPPAVERPGTAARPVPVVLVGHRAPRTDPCHPTPMQCGGLMLVERVAWSDGVAFDPGPVFDAWLETSPPGLPIVNLDSAEVLAIGWSGTILQAALLRPPTVASVDADAGRALAANRTQTSLVWYVRGLETGYDPWKSHGSATPRYSWVVLDYVTGDTLARGPIYSLTGQSAS